MYIYIYTRFNQQKNVGKNQHDQPTRNVKMYKKPQVRSTFGS